MRNLGKVIRSFRSRASLIKRLLLLNTGIDVTDKLLIFFMLFTAFTSNFVIGGVHLRTITKIIIYYYKYIAVYYI